VLVGSGSSELVGSIHTNCTAIDAVLSFSAIALAMKVPRIADNKSQQVAVVIWGVVLLGTYSFLLSVFRVKNGGYPFFLPPF
jgi:oligosaccharyltransferase complex subunit gamma